MYIGENRGSSAPTTQPHPSPCYSLTSHPPQGACTAVPSAWNASPPHILVGPSLTSFGLCPLVSAYMVPPREAFPDLPP